MRRLALLTLLLVLLPVVFATAQTKKGGAPKPAPGVPTLTTPVSLGLQRGKTHSLTLTGTNLNGASDVSILGCSTPISIAVPKDQTDAGKLKVLFDLPDSTPIGLYQLRVASPGGVSQFRPISIDCVPDVADNGANTTVEKAQTVQWPCVVTGTIAAESADYYRFSVKAGQTINIDCHARRLGSPLDPAIVLHDAKTGRELPSLYADDTPGLQSDCQFVHTFKEAGEYLVQVRDSTYKGGADFTYRLRITSSPAVNVAFPPVRQTPKDPLTISPSRAGDPVVGWPVAVLDSDAPQIVEQEPNDDIKTANKLSMPGGVSARFEKKGDKDLFSFPAKKGQRIEAVCLAAEIGSPTEVLLRILDGAGKELVASDPQKPSARTEFTAPADGTYYASAEHLNYLFGPGEIYHLSVRPIVPQFDVVMGADKIDLPETGFSLIPIVGLARLNGFSGPLTLTATGEGIAGELVLPASAAPTPANPIYFPVRSKAEFKGITPFQIVAKGGEVSKPATATEICRAGLGGLTHLPVGWVDRMVACEIPTAPVTLGWLGSTFVPIGGSSKITVDALRHAGDGDIVLAGLGMPVNVTVKVKPVAKGQKTGEVEIVADAKAAAGRFDLYIKATIKTESGERSTFVGPISCQVAPAPKKPEVKKEEPKKK
ncbi:MAG: PPC domain-containing protein [Gemmataceae bacterium]